MIQILTFRESGWWRESEYHQQSIGSYSPVAAVGVLGTVARALCAVAVGREMRLVFPQEAEVVDDGRGVGAMVRTLEHLGRGFVR